MLTAHEAAALAVIFIPAFAFMARGTVNLVLDIIDWARRRRDSARLQAELDYWASPPEAHNPFLCDACIAQDAHDIYGDFVTYERETFADYVRSLDESVIDPERTLQSDEPPHDWWPHRTDEAYDTDPVSFPTLARAKTRDELERDEYDTTLSTWVARALNNDLPTYGVHAGAYAYVPESER